MLVQLFKANKTEQSYIYRWKPTNRLNIVPVVIATIPLAASAKTIPVWVSIAVTAGMTALSVGYKFLTQPKGTKGISSRDWSSNVVSTEQHLPVVYGRTRLGISPVFVSSAENAKNEKHQSVDWLFCVAAICHGEIESIQRVILNNEGKHALVAKNETGELTINEFYGGFAYFSKETGKSTISKAYKKVQTVFPRWSNNHLGKGVASLCMALRYNAEKFPAGVPNVIVEIEGTKVHDPRDASYPNDTIAYSNNPALCVLDYLKSTVYGASATEDEIDKNSFIIAANYCDQVLSYTQIDPPPPISAKLIDANTELYTGSSQQYNYKYALGTLTNTNEYAVTSWTVMSNLSAVASCTVTKAYGVVNLSGIANNALYSRVIFRKELTSALYKMVGSIDPGDDSTIFIDNTKEAELGDTHLSVGAPPAAPSGLVATFLNFTSSALDTLKYYRYKIVYKTATGTHTEASDASNQIKTKKSKNAVRLNIPVSEDTKVTSREIYRTSGFASGTVPAASDYKLLTTISNNTQEVYYDYLGDGSLSPTEEAPSTNNTTVSAQKMFTCNGIVDTSRDIMTNLEELLTSCRGRLFYESGKYSLSIRTTAVPEVFELTEDNIIGDWSYSTPGTREVCNIIKASYINPDQSWQPDYVIWPPAADNNLYLGDDYGFKINKEIDLPFTTNKKTAKQIAQVIRKETRQTIAVSLTAKEEALKLKANTLVKVTHSSPGWTDKLFWVDAIKILPNATVGLALTEYDSTVYDYELIAKDTVGGADTTLPDPTNPPDEVTNVVIVDEMYGLTPTQIADGVPAASPLSNWRLKITYTDPASTFWHHSDIYVKKGSVGKYIQMGMVDINSRGVFYIYPVEPFIPYYIKFLSISDFGPRMLLDDATEWSHTISPTPPNLITNLRSLNKGNDTTTEGRDFVITWAAVSMLGSGYSQNSVSASISSIETEKISYDIEVRLLPPFIINGTNYPGIPNSVLLNNGQKVNIQLLNTYTTNQTEFTYTYEKNIADINKLFSKQTTNINYENFYGHAQRTLEFRVYTKNRWGKRSSGYSSIKLHNSRPTMVDINGNTIIPECKEGLSSLEFTWEHPFAEIDITHFMAKLVGKSSSDSDGLYSDANMLAALASIKRKPSTAYNVGAFVFPEPANGHVYRCSAATGNKKTSSAQESFTKPTTATPHPFLYDGNVTWTHFCMLRFQKVMSLIDINSEDDDISVAHYTAKFQNLDPKKSFRFKVVSHDVYGAGNMSKVVSATPGTTHDITDDEDIAAPDQVTGVSITINSNNNVVAQWTKPIVGVDALDVTEAIIDWRASQFTGTPTLTLTSADPPGSIPTLAERDQRYLNSDNTKAVIGKQETISISIDEAEIYTTNSFIIPAAKVGYTYFVRVRLKNSSNKAGAWSAWTYNTTAVTGISDDDFSFKYKKAYYTGSLKAAGTSDGYRRATWGNPDNVVMKISKSGGGTNNYSITDGNTGDLPIDGTGNRWIVWRSNYSGGQAFEVVTDSDLADSATYENAIAVAYVIPTSNTDGKITIIPTLGTNKDTVFSSAVIASNSILANHIKVNSLSAISALLGSLLMSHSDGSSITIKDSAGTKRIFLSTQDGAAPVLRISKATKDASTALAQADCLFTSEDDSANPVSYKKVLDEFIYEIPDTADWQDKTVTAGQNTFSGTVYIAGDNFPTGYGTTLPREVIGTMFPNTNSAANCEELIMGTTDGDLGASAAFQYVQINFRTVGGEGLVRLDRVCVNPLTANRTFPSLVGNKIKITVYADQVG